MDKKPTLTDKQELFLYEIFVNRKSQTEAYRCAYDCQTMSTRNICIEASKLMKNPNITPWVEWYKKNKQQVAKEEIDYSQKDFFDELEDLHMIALESLDKNGNPNVGAAKGIVELKGKAKGYLKNEVELSGGAVVQMGEVKIGGKQLSFNIGNNEDGNPEQLKDSGEDGTSDIT